MSNQSGMIASQPIPQSPTSLLSLTPELITRISAHLAHSDALSLGLTARTFLVPSETRLWRDLDLFLHTNYGEYPLVQPHARGEKDHAGWAIEECEKAAARHSVELRQRIRRLLMVAGARRLGSVRKVSVVQKPGALYGMVQLLEMVSPHLVVLEVNDPGPPTLNWPPDFHETLDYKVFDAGLLFPSLTTVRLGKWSINYSEFILVLCAAAPNLVDLFIAHHHYLPPEHASPPFPTSLARNTKLERLRLAFNNPKPGSDSGSDEGLSDADDPTSEALLELLDSSPNLQQLSVQYHDHAEGVMFPFSTFLEEHEHLEDLHLTIDSFFFELWTASSPIPCLRRLVLEPMKWSDIFLIPPGVANLEVLCLLGDTPEPDESGMPTSTSTTLAVPAYVPSLSVHAMMPYFADTLRLTPCLQIIHTLTAPRLGRDLNLFDKLDAIQALGQTTGRIRSFRHGEHEMLHAKLLLEVSEVSDEPGDEESGYSPWDQPLFSYHARDGSLRLKTFAPLPTPAWFDFTDFDGVAVPLSVIEKMREVEKATEEAWQGRGVEVGDEAWAVLVDWKEENDRAMGRRRSKRKIKKRS